MSNIITQLYRGQLEPKNVLGNGNVELRSSEILIEKNFHKLKENLNEETKVILEKYSQCIDEYIVLISEQAFYDGFCLGTRIISEAIGGAERIIQKNGEISLAVNLAFRIQHFEFDYISSFLLFTTTIVVTIPAITISEPSAIAT